MDGNIGTILTIVYKRVRHIGYGSTHSSKLFVDEWGSLVHEQVIQKCPFVIGGCILCEQMGKKWEFPFIYILPVDEQFMTQQVPFLFLKSLQFVIGISPKQ